jgi:hypothetical protein
LTFISAILAENTLYLIKGVIFVKKKDWRQTGQLLMVGALVSVIMAGIGYTGADIWLASTQWLLVAAVMALFGIYARMNA